MVRTPLRFTFSNSSFSRLVSGARGSSFHGRHMTYTKHKDINHACKIVVEFIYNLQHIHIHNSTDDMSGQDDQNFIMETVSSSIFIGNSTRKVVYILSNYMEMPFFGLSSELNVTNL